MAPGEAFGPAVLEARRGTKYVTLEKPEMPQRAQLPQNAPPPQKPPNKIYSGMQFAY